ncbi:MAG: DNA polymerase III subunit beta [Brevinemataceae bacterium]
MKFNIGKDEFLKALSTADSIINPRTPLSILLNVYLEVHNDGQVIIQSYNGDHGVKIEVSAEVEEAGKISLPSKKMLEIVKTIPGSHVSFEKNEDSLEMVIRPKDKQSPVFRLNGALGDTYPTFKEFNWESYIRLSQEVLRELISATEFSVSNDPAQIAFTGTFIHEEIDGMLSFVSTDGKRLAVISKSIEEKVGSMSADVIVPQKIMKTVADSLSQGDALLSIYDGQAYFKIDNVYVFTNLVEGKFPNYRDVIPSQTTSIITVDASEFAASLQRVSVMSDNESGRVKLEVEGRNLVISGSTQQGIGNDAVEIENIEGNNEIPFVSVNYRTLTDFLKILQGKKICVAVNSAASPILLTPAGESDYEYITMPMK